MPKESLVVLANQDLGYFLDFLKANGITELKIENQILNFDFEIASLEVNPNSHWFQAFGSFGQLLLENVISPAFYSWLRFHGADGSQRAGPNSPSAFVIYFPLPRQS